MDLSGLISTDSRTPLEKLRRNALQKICKENNIPFDPSGDAVRLRQLIEGSGVDYMKSEFFNKIQVQDENGMVKETVVPVVKPHATENKDINYDAIIEAKANAQEKEDENKELKEKMAKLEAALLKLTPSETPTDEAYYRNKYVEIFGKKPHHKMKVETIQAKVNGQNAS